MRNKRTTLKKSVLEKMGADDKSQFLSMVEAYLEKYDNLELKPREFKRFNSLSDKRKPFVDKALEVVHNKPKLMPNSFNVNDFEHNYNTFMAYRSMLDKLKVLESVLKEQCFKSGHDCYNSAMTVSKILKLTSKNSREAKSYYNELNALNSLKKND